jgi:hypothetical protein
MSEARPRARPVTQAPILDAAARLTGIPYGLGAPAVKPPTGGVKLAQHRYE